MDWAESAWIYDRALHPWAVREQVRGGECEAERHRSAGGYEAGGDRRCVRAVCGVPAPHEYLCRGDVSTGEGGRVHGRGYAGGQAAGGSAAGGGGDRVAGSDLYGLGEVGRSAAAAALEAGVRPWRWGALEGSAFLCRTPSAFGMRVSGGSRGRRCRP